MYWYRLKMKWDYKKKLCPVSEEELGKSECVGICAVEIRSEFFPRAHLLQYN
jgi:hypothetical protein